jgi:pilus assembly protein TadC
MTYPSSLQSALDLLSATNIKPRAYAPRLYRTLWRLGVYVPPPHFASPLFNAALLGVIFGPSWGLVMYVLVWSSEGMPWFAAVAAALVAGLLFGLTMAFYYRRSARKHGLPPWSQLKAHHV